MFYYDNSEAWRVEAITYKNGIVKLQSGVIFEKTPFVKDEHLADKTIVLSVKESFNFNKFLADILQIDIVNVNNLTRLVLKHGGL